MLTDVRYAMAQLRRRIASPHNSTAEVIRALDALERVEAGLLDQQTHEADAAAKEGLREPDTMEEATIRRLQAPLIFTHCLQWVEFPIHPCGCPNCVKPVESWTVEEILAREG